MSLSWGTVSGTLAEIENSYILVVPGVKFTVKQWHQIMEGDE